MQPRIAENVKHIIVNSCGHEQDMEEELLDRGSSRGGEKAIAPAGAC